MGKEPKKLYQLFIPIFIEILFMMLTGAVDTLMLSSEGDQAVGAVGTANSYISIFIIMFSVISAGMVAVMTQYIGAGHPGTARQALGIGVLFNMSAGVVITTVLGLFPGQILGAVGIAPQLLEPATVYLRTVGLFCMCNALTPIFSSYLRSFGHTTPTLAATTAANLVNIALNALFLYGFRWGVLGVALATGISRLTNLVWLMIAAARRVRVEKEAQPLPNFLLLRRILRVGLPAAMETALYNLAITLVIRFLNQMDETGAQATARSYAIQITNFSYCAGAALAQANAILVGWRIGRGDLEACDRGTKKAALIAMGAGMAIAGLFALFSRPIVGLFSDDPEMVRLVGVLLAIDVVLEAGRTLNLVFGTALKTGGDAVFPMTIAVVFAFVCAAGGTWLFGIRLGWLAAGAYAAMALDECVRAVLMFARWQSGRWKRHKLIG